MPGSFKQALLLSIVYRTNQFFKSCHGVNKWSISKGAHHQICYPKENLDFRSRDRHFAPLVTIFWKFSMHTGTDQHLIFQKNWVWLNNFNLDFKIRACQQCHLYFEPEYILLNHFQPNPEFVCLCSICIWILIFCDYLSNDQTILFHFYYKYCKSGYFCACNFSHFSNFWHFRLFLNSRFSAILHRPTHKINTFACF